jgi:hypothetical protein
MAHAHVFAKKGVLLLPLHDRPARLPAPSVAQSAAATGVSRRTFYRWRADDPEFAARWAAIAAQRWADHRARCETVAAEGHARGAALHA